MEMRITIRQAVADDADLIACAVAMAIGDGTVQTYCGDQYLQALSEVAKNKYSQYSYHNALVAEVDGFPAGVVVGYDGALLNSLRQVTLSVIRCYNPNVRVSEDETESGEFYLDTLAVYPQYRGMSIGKMLIEAICKKALSEGHNKVGLIVDVDNPKAEHLYTSVGFKQVGLRLFFGHQMHHLQKQV